MDRKQGRNAYRDELQAEFFAVLPQRLFRRLTVHGNSDWTPRKVVTLSVIMFWSSGNTLEEQFSAARTPTVSTTTVSQQPLPPPLAAGGGL